VRGPAQVIGIAASAVAIVVSGCGGDDSKSTSSLTKEQFVQQANAVCKRHNETISAAANKLLAGGKLPPPQAFGKLVLGTIVPEVRAQTSELEGIKAPAELDGPYRTWLTDTKGALSRLAANPSLIKSPASFRAVNGQADHLGLSPKCHAGPG